MHDGPMQVGAINSHALGPKVLRFFNRKVIAFSGFEKNFPTDLSGFWRCDLNLRPSLVINNADWQSAGRRAFDGEVFTARKSEPQISLL